MGKIVIFSSEYDKIRTFIIPRARMGFVRPRANWAIDSEAMRARGIIVLVKSNLLHVVGQKYRDKTTFSWLKLDVNPFLPPKLRFRIY